MKALLLSDGRPGHYHLAEGVLAALARLRPVEVARIEVRKRRLLPGRVLARLTAAGASAPTLLRLAYGLTPAALPAADVVVSAGGDTLTANLAAARLLGVPNIFYGSVRYFSPQDFSLILLSHPGLAHLPRHVMTMKPSPADPALVPASTTIAGAPRFAGLLAGGPTSLITYTDAEWERVAGFLRAEHAASGMSWIVSNSRRTPQSASARFAALAAEPGSPIASFIDVREAGAGTLGDLFARAGPVLVTVDSSSMVSEAIWMQRPAICLVPARSGLTANERSYRAWLAAKGWMREIAIADLDPQTFAEAVASIRPPERNPLDDLAGILAAHLPHLTGRAGA